MNVPSPGSTEDVHTDRVDIEYSLFTCGAHHQVRQGEIIELECLGSGIRGEGDILEWFQAVRPAIIKVSNVKI